MSVYNEKNQNLWLDDMLVSRAAQSENTIINLDDGVTIGGDDFVVMAGPCAIETRKQILETAMAVRKAGADIFAAELLNHAHHLTISVV